MGRYGCGMEEVRLWLGFVMGGGWRWNEGARALRGDVG